MMKKIKKRILCCILAIISVLTIVPCTPVMAAEDYSAGGWNQLASNTTVVNANGSTVGTVYAGEGVTILYFSGDRAYIEYSASSSAKRGYVSKNAFKYIGKYNQTAVGRVTASCTTYYSPGTTHYAGTISSGEYVSVLCKSGNWAYVEYNVSNGLRKRAFMPTANLQCYSSDIRSSFYHDTGVIGLGVSVFSNMTVYAGPNGSSYSVAGTIYASDNGQVFSYSSTFSDASGRRMMYVSYPSGNGTKYGYIYY